MLTDTPGSHSSWLSLNFSKVQPSMLCGDDFRSRYFNKWKIEYGFFVLFWFWFFRDRVFLCSSGCPGTHFVDQAGLELRNLPDSASQVLGLKVIYSFNLSKCVHVFFSFFLFQSFKNIFLYSMLRMFFFLYNTLWGCLVPAEAWIVCQIPGTGVTEVVSHHVGVGNRTELGSSTRTARALSPGSQSP